MNLGYITLSIATILILLFIIYCLINQKSISSLDDIHSKISLNHIFTPFEALLIKYDFLMAKLVESKLKIVFRNMYGDDNYEYQIKYLSKKIFILSHMLLLLLILYPFINQVLVLIAGILFIILFNFFLDKNQILLYKNKQEELKNNLPNFISRLILMLGAGINLRTSINYILKMSKGEIVDSFHVAHKYISNGYSESEAYNLVLNKTDDVLIRKFIASILQNLEKGGDDLESLLSLIKKESDEYKKTNTILKTQQANRKLLIPNLVIFTGIMLMVMLPILLNAI